MLNLAEGVVWSIVDGERVKGPCGRPQPSTFVIFPVCFADVEVEY